MGFTAEAAKRERVRLEPARHGGRARAPGSRGGGKVSHLSTDVGSGGRQAAQRWAGAVMAVRRLWWRVPGAGRISRWLRPAGRLDPDSVAYSDAMRFFERSRPSYEAMAELIAGQVDPHGVIIDVGSNIGYFSRILMERIRFDGQAHLFEPVPRLADLCRRTFADRAFRVTVHPFALGDEDAELDIYMASDGNIGWNTIIAAKAQEGMKRLRVPIRRFDALGLPSPAFVKIDVEGAEHRVLRGMLPSLQAAPRLPLILCEVGWGRSHPEWLQLVAVFRELEALGYLVQDLTGRSVDIGLLETTQDVILVPPVA